MDEEIRKQPLQLNCFAGKQQYCIFAKIESGTVMFYYPTDQMRQMYKYLNNKNFIRINYSPFFRENVFLLPYRPKNWNV